MGGDSPARQRNDAIVYTVFLALPVLLFIVFYIYPVVDTIRLSFQSWNGLARNRTNVGLANYFALAKDARFYGSVLNNMRWLIFYLLMPTSFGLALAMLANSLTKGQTLFKLICFLPYVLPPVAVAAIWRWLYEPSAGLVTRLLQEMGLGAFAQNWIGNPAIVTYALMVAALWWSTGFSFIIFFAGLRNLPQECLEAARVDGVSSIQTFLHITFPLLWPSTAVALGMSCVSAMRLFDIVWATTSGGPAYASDVLATQMYDVAFGCLKMGEASAIAVCMLVISASFIMPFIVYMARRVEAASNAN
jgi:raffinose/stachyose/melibiose transport system permease protein